MVPSDCMRALPEVRQSRNQKSPSSFNHLVAWCCAKSLSRVWLSVTPWTVAHQAPMSMGFSRQEYWSGSPFPPPGDLPDPGIEPSSLRSPVLAGGFFTSSATWEVVIWLGCIYFFFKSNLQVVINKPCDQCRINYVISAWSVTWSVHDQSRDQCMISHVISAWSAKW